VVTVRDNGVGIPASMLPHIFEMFTQVDRTLERSQGGLGIGLTLVRRLLELHGGTVEARSAGHGLGSEFIVRLPLAFAATPAALQLRSGEGDSRSARPKHTIVVADDNEDSATSLTLMLRIMGHEVHVVHDGLAAVQAAGTLQPNVVLLDIGMPRLNGYEAAQRIRQQPWGKRMVLIALTGWGQEEDRRRSEEAGFDHHLVKPADPAALEKLLASVEGTPT
jgi:CheY-like chemotaxis protein